MIAAALAPVNAYLLVLLGAAAWGRRDGPAPPADGARMRFVVIVPARDEEGTIGGTLASLAALDHPRELVEVVVVADHCTDGTAAEAAAAGATVWPRTTGGGGKGGALAWALARTTRERPDADAVAIVDADCTVGPGFLTAVERRMRAGARAVQVAYLVGNPEASAVAALRYASFALVNVVRPLGKARLGLSAGLFGTGMAFARELLVGQPWAADSLVEDQEQHLRLVAAGVRVAFAPEARVVSAMPTTLRRSTGQGLRWDAGRAELIRTWTPRLLRAGLRGRDAAQLHAGLEPLVPPQSLLLAGNLTAALAARSGGRASRRAAAAGLAAQVGFVAGGLALVRAPASVWRSLACAPALVAWKLALLARLWAGRGPAAWVRTEREPQRSRSAIRRS